MRHTTVRRGPCLALALLTTLGACVATRVKPQLTALPSPTQASLRGLHVVSAEVAWASGTGGTVLRTTDGGHTWQLLSVKGYGTTDFRDVHARDAESAWLLGSGHPGLVLSTVDGGHTWQEVLRDARPGVFFDALAMAADGRGLVLSDPIDGRMVLWSTTDHGRTWQEIKDLPTPLVGEAMFAASGTCLQMLGAHVWIATGGGPQARVLRSQDGGRSWAASGTPVVAGADSRGIFSVAFANAQDGVVVGGDYRQASQAAAVAARSNDGGATWAAVAAGPGGYRSCVAWVPGHDGTLLAVGEGGADWSLDGGTTWNACAGSGYHTLGFAPDAPVGFAAGKLGQLARITWE